MIPVDFTKQIVPGTLEYTIHGIVENRIDLSDKGENKLMFKVPDVPIAFFDLDDTLTKKNSN